LIHLPRTEVDIVDSLNEVENWRTVTKNK